MKKFILLLTLVHIIIGGIGNINLWVIVDISCSTVLVLLLFCTWANEMEEELYKLQSEIESLKSQIKEDTK